MGNLIQKKKEEEKRIKRRRRRRKQKKTAVPVAHVSEALEAIRFVNRFYKPARQGSRLCHKLRTMKSI